jgi:hypothetical protein
MTPRLRRWRSSLQKEQPFNWVPLTKDLQRRRLQVLLARRGMWHPDGGGLTAAERPRVARIDLRQLDSGQAYVLIIGGGPPKPKRWPIPCSTVVTMVWMTCGGISSVMKVLITAP